MKKYLWETEDIYNKLADTGMAGRSMADQYRAEKEELERLRKLVDSLQSSLLEMKNVLDKRVEDLEVR